MISKKQVYIETYGCQMNVNDSERIVTLLDECGYAPTTTLSRADLVLLNTCTVRGGAEERVYKRLENLKALKRKKQSLLIGIGGCVAQYEGDALLDRFPWVSLVFGTHNLHLLPQLVAAAEQGQRRSETSFIDNAQRLDLFPVIRGGVRVSRFVTVMQGCDNFCSYCIVPFVRGHEISRRSGDIISEITRLADEGVMEVVLLGQNVNSYGVGAGHEMSFPDLLQRVAAIDGIRRIRFTTSHPKDMSDELINCFSTVPKLCGQIQLPAQSGSNPVLERMNRGYSRERYLDRINALKTARPGIIITGDMIVGFPGETESDFQETLSLMEDVRYADLFSFAYSPRPGTRAAGMPDDVPKAEKQRRLEELISLQKRITLEINSTFTGTVQTILAEGFGKRPGQLSGRADSGKTVNFPGPAELVGTFVPVKITDAFQNSLVGEMV